MGSKGLRLVVRLLSFTDEHADHAMKHDLTKPLLNVDLLMREGLQTDLPHVVAAVVASAASQLDH